MITLDSSAIVALADTREPNHPRAVAALAKALPSVLVPAGILGEIGYMLEQRGDGLDAFLESLEDRSVSLECGEEDLPRIRELLARYADLHLGFSDAAVIACAERNGGQVLTFDVRDFSVVAREGTITIVPEPPP